jgi:hypothetical protein
VEEDRAGEKANASGGRPTCLYLLARTTTAFLLARTTTAFAPGSPSQVAPVVPTMCKAPVLEAVSAEQYLRGLAHRCASLDADPQIQRGRPSWSSRTLRTRKPRDAGIASGPWGPIGPGTPRDPWAPDGPAPRSLLGPCGPAGPRAPASPFGPCRPATWKPRGTTRGSRSPDRARVPGAARVGPNVRLNWCGDTGR